jgi:hypothetical protein
MNFNSFKHYSDFYREKRFHTRGLINLVSSRSRCRSDKVLDELRGLSQNVRSLNAARSGEANSLRPEDGGHLRFQFRPITVQLGSGKGLRNKKKTFNAREGKKYISLLLSFSIIDGNETWEKEI